MENFTNKTTFVLSFLLAIFLLTGNVFADIKPVPTTSHAAFLDAIHVPAAWKEGYTGYGVSVGIVDDGIDKNHPFYNLVDSVNFGAKYNGTDVLQKIIDENSGNIPQEQNFYDSSGVWDNIVVKDKDNPQGNVDTGDTHGTPVTGSIGAYDTKTQTYGPAFNANLTGIRYDFAYLYLRNDDPLVFDVFAEAFKYNSENIQLKNNSIAPTSIGYISGGAKPIIESFACIKDSTSMFFSACNERDKGNEYSNCSDSNKRYWLSHPSTIVVAATGGEGGDKTDYGVFTSYSNYGACVFVCAPGEKIRSSDRVDEQSTGYYYLKDEQTYVGKATYQGDKKGNSVDSNGTSASSPVATAVAALGVEAYNQTFPNLSITPRYLKHMLARTSTKIDENATDANVKWVTNSAGLSFSHTYGFGQVNAENLVNTIVDSKHYLQGGLYSDVTEQSTFTAQWFKDSYICNWLIEPSLYPKIISSEEKLLYNVVDVPANGSDGNNTVQPNADQTTTSNFQTLSEIPKTILMTNFTSDDFRSVNTIQQHLEEVVLTIDMSPNTRGGYTYFDSRQLEIVLEHGVDDNLTRSYMVFAEPDSLSDNANKSTLQWSFSSNAFWGEDPTAGYWTLLIFFHEGEEGITTYKINNLWTTFYMGELTSQYYDLETSGVIDTQWNLDEEHNGVILNSGDEAEVTHSQALNISTNAGISVGEGYTLEQTGQVTISDETDSDDSATPPELAIGGKGVFKLNPTSAIAGDDLAKLSVARGSTLELAGPHTNLTFAKEAEINGTLDFNDYNGEYDMQINNLSGTGEIKGTDKNLILFSDKEENVSVFEGSIDIGTGKITKTGTGVLKINAQKEDYSSITAESFLIQAGEMDLKGYYAGQIKVEANASLSPGNSVGKLYVNGNVTFDKGSTLIMEIAGKEYSENDYLEVDGDLIFDTGSSILLTLAEGYQLNFNETFTAYIGSKNVSSVDWSKLLKSYYFKDISYTLEDGYLKITGALDPNAVPEPSTWALLILGVAGLLWKLRREKRVARKI